MGEIDRRRIDLAYDVARRFHADQLTEADGASELVACGMNSASAKIYIRTFRAMLEGKTFKRTLSAQSFAVFLERITQDYGAIVGKRAVFALRSHVAYYNLLGRGNLNRVAMICDEAEATLLR